VDVWEEAMARTLAGAGATRNDTVQNCYGYGLFTGGLGVHYGAKRLGANIIPMSSGNTQKQLMVMQAFSSTILTCTPSYALYMAEEAAESGIDVKSMKLRAGCFGAEPWSENMRKEIEAKYGIDAYDIYGLTEITGPGVAFECEAKDGLHINEDFFYPEIIDPATGQVLPDGEKGELVFTTLVKEGTPLIRYRTRDVTFLRREPCSCGRTTVKMNRLFGRTDDMLIIRGVNVFPSQIEHALIEIEGTDPHYLIIVDRGPSHLDEVELQVEVKKELFGDETKNLEALRNKIEGVMKSKLGIALRVKLVEPKTIERSIGKAKRVIDRRTL
jgi:phenylacetate-CoA ligase